MARMYGTAALRLTVLCAFLVTLCSSAAIFYYNVQTGASTHERPPEMAYYDSQNQPYWVVNGETTRTPPTDWAWVAGEKDGRAFWHNLVTKESVWDQPVAAAWSARDSDKPFYVNVVTKESTYERPAVLGVHAEEHNATYYVDGDGNSTWEAPLDAQWREVTDPDTGRPYYHNEKSGETTWEPPPDSNVAWQRWFAEPDGAEF